MHSINDQRVDELPFHAKRYSQLTELQRGGPEQLMRLTQRTLSQLDAGMCFALRPMAVLPLAHPDVFDNAVVSISTAACGETSTISSGR